MFGLVFNYCFNACLINIKIAFFTFVFLYIVRLGVYHRSEHIYMHPLVLSGPGWHIRIKHLIANAYAWLVCVHNSVCFTCLALVVLGLMCNLLAHTSPQACVTGSGSCVAFAMGCMAGGYWYWVRSARPAVCVRVSSVLFLRSDLRLTVQMESCARVPADGGLHDSFTVCSIVWLGLFSAAGLRANLTRLTLSCHTGRRSLV